MRATWTCLMLAMLCSLSLAANDKKTAEQISDLGLTAVGRQHHPIHSKNPEAQAYFDQGITFLYGFNHEEAGKAFERAAELDPASPMPLWGIALAAGPNYNMDVDAAREKMAYEISQKARKLAEHATQVERDYVAALAVRYSGDASPDYRKLSRDYAGAMKELSQKYPDDLDAATLYAESLMNLNPWHLWSLDGKPAENTDEILRVLESVLARDPNHAGANHYYIHAVEASPNPGRALPSAHRLDTMVPQAGHLVHMPAHIYSRIGDYAAAAKTNAEAAKVDAIYARKAEREGSVYDLMYHSHNEHFFAAASCMEGRYADAKQAAAKLAARLQPYAKSMPMLDGFLSTPIWVDVRFSNWAATLARPEPAKELAATHILWRYARAFAFARQGEVEKAVAERDQFVKEAAAFPVETRWGLQESSKGVLSLAGHAIDARIAAANKNQDDAIAHWRKAVEAQDALDYDEPADWYYPVRESLGGALLSAGKAAEAEQVFRDDLQQNPRNPRSLFGLLQSLNAQQKDADATWVEKEFQEAWKNADSKLQVSDL
ncbi:MAG: tetratricopeptide repeat protein [Candidatus Acidiferrum sp.]